MPIALLVIGVVILITAFKGTSKDLGTLLHGDFTGQNNFTIWLLAIAFIGGFSYIPGFKPVANMFFALLIIVILLANQKGTTGGFFVNLNKAFQGTALASPLTSLGVITK